MKKQVVIIFLTAAFLVFGIFACFMFDIFASSPMVPGVNLVGFQKSDWNADASILFIGKYYGIYKSTDHGKSTSLGYTIPTGVNHPLFIPDGLVWTVFIPKRVSGEKTDTLFVSVSGTGKLYRFTNITSATPTVDVVLDLGTQKDAGIVAMTEDSAGNLYAGEYHLPWTDQQANVYKSTNRGKTWPLLHNFKTGHIHFVKVNPYNNWLYVVCGESGDYDGNTDASSVFRSKDGTDNFVRVFNGINYFGHGTELTHDGITFLNNDVYLGEDGDFKKLPIWKFTDTGSGEPFTITSVFTPPTDNALFDDASTLNGTLFFTSEADCGTSRPECSGNDAITTQAVSSTDGENWTVINSTSTTKPLSYWLSWQTSHPERYNRVFYALSNATGYYIDYTDTGSVFWQWHLRFLKWWHIQFYPDK